MSNKKQNVTNYEPLKLRAEDDKDLGVLSECLFESVCLGIPSIATDCPTGPKEILNNGDQGILIPMNSVKHMVDAIRLLIEDEDLRLKFINSSKITKVRYSSERIASLYLDAINSMH